MKKYHFIISFIGIALFVLIFSYLYVYNEDNVYVYDYIGYYNRWIYLSQKFNEGIYAGFKELFASIRFLDYNSLPVLFIVPSYFIFANSRLVYILSLTGLFVAPTIYLNSIYIHKSINKKKFVTIFYFIILFLLLYTRYYSPTIRGLPDILGVIPLIIISLKLPSYSYCQKIKYKNLVFYGLLLYLPFLFRRWYAYNVISMYITIFFVSIYDLYRSEDKKQNLIFILKNFVISGFTSLISLILLQFDLVKSIFNNNYSNSYSAYQISISSHLTSFFNEFGVLIVFFACFGIMYSLIKKQNKRYMFFNLLNALLFVSLFTRTQGLGVHHYLGLSFFIINISALGCLYIYDLLKSKWLKNMYLLFIIGLMSMNFLTTFVTRNHSIPIISQNNKYYKLRYTNMNNLLLLTNDLTNFIVGDYPVKHKVAVLASNDDIADSLLYTVGNNELKNAIVYSSNIDLRDGLNFIGLLADYVVVTSKPICGTNYDGQQVLAYTNNLIFKEKGIGKNYEKISGPYILNNNIEAYIYKKKAKFSEQDVDDYLKYFYSLYPDWEERYNEFHKSILLSQAILGDEWGQFSFIDDDTLYVHPGFNDTIVTFPVNNIDKLKFKFYVNGEVEEPKKQGIINVILKDEKKILDKTIVSTKNSSEINIDLSESNNLILEINYGEHLDCDWLYIDIIDVVENKNEKRS